MKPDDVLIRGSTGVNERDTQIAPLPRKAIVGYEQSEIEIPRNYAVTGIVEQTGGASKRLGEGDKVVAYVGPAKNKADGVSPSHLVVSETSVCKKQSTATLEETAYLVLATLAAATILNGQLGLSFSSLEEGQGDVSSNDKKKVLIIGGETAIGAAMVQLLKHASPNCQTLVLTDIKDQQDLFQRVVHITLLGAIYAIDQNAEDLMQHVKARADVIIDVRKSVSTRPELLELLAESGRLISCMDLNIKSTRSEDILNGIGGMTRVGELVTAAIDIFNAYEAPGCSFAAD